MSIISEFFRGKRPEDVFTPRSPVVNQSMYVDRPHYQTELRRAIRTGYNIIIYGDSGCGKSWLYKKVFSDEGIFSVTLDLTSCKDSDDVDLLALEILEKDFEWIEDEKVSTFEKTATPWDVGVKSSEEKSYRRPQVSPIEQLCDHIYSKSKGRPCFIVFENLEHCIENDDVIKFLRALVLSLDDRGTIRSKVQICFVGVPNDIKNILCDSNKYQTISNRVTEIPEVGRMSKDEARHLIYQGFVGELEFTVENFDFCVSQIIYLTDRIPQYIHDVCLQVAFEAEDRARNLISPAVVVSGAHRWVQSNDRQSKDFVESILGPNRRRKDAKSRVVFTISKCEYTNFYCEDIEKLLCEVFPVTYGKKARVSIRSVLNKLSSGSAGLLKYDNISRKYRIANPKVRSVIRHYLQVDPNDEAVLVRDYSAH